MVRISILSKLLSQDYMKLKFLELWNDLQNDNCYQNPVGACKWNYFLWKLHQMALLWGLIMSGEYSLKKYMTLHLITQGKDTSIYLLIKIQGAA